MYAEAIKFGVPGKPQAVYYTNSATANFKLENYGLTLLDASEAIKADPTFFKAYFRRGSAYVIL